MSNFIYIAGEEISALTDVTKLDVDDSGITLYTLTAGKKGCMLQNSGGGITWFGGATTVSATNLKGNALDPRDTIVGRKVSPRFTVGFRCATGVTTTISIVEW